MVDRIYVRPGLKFVRRCLICAALNPCPEHSAEDQLAELKRNDKEIERLTGKNPNDRLKVY